jgi:amidase
VATSQTLASRGTAWKTPTARRGSCWVGPAGAEPVFNAPGAGKRHVAMADDSTLFSALHLVAGLRDGRWTSLELTRYFLDRIARDDSNAVVWADPEVAAGRAAEVDRRRAEGKPVGLLQGLPFTVKDAYRVKGQPSTWGFRHYRNYRPGTTSQVVQALIDEDGIIIGRTAVPTGLFNWNCRNQIHPECRNPFDPTRTPGGSSGGAAAALALGLTPIEVGSDIAGSIRYPAHCCGVAGLRTTDGWLPVQDSGPEGMPYPFSGLAVAGPMGRTLEDVELLVEILCRHFPLPDASSPSRSGSPRVAFSRSPGPVKADAATGEVLQELLETFQAAGAEVVEASPDVDWEELYRAWCTLVGYEYARSLPRFLTTGLKKVALDQLLFRKLGSGFMRSHLLKGMSASTRAYQEAIERRELAQREIDRFFSQYDLWAAPVSPSPAVPLSECGRRIKTSEADFDYSYYLGLYLCPTAMFGTPAVAVPAGRAGSLPIGIQIHGPRFSDPGLVRTVRNLCHQRII